MQLGVGVAIAGIAGLVLLMIALGPLLDDSYEPDAVLLLGALVAAFGSSLLLLGVDLPDWWPRIGGR